MEEKKTDRRTLKTRKAICDAIMEFLIEKELRKITVQEISDKADINRATFYKHYLDVYDLYDKLEQDILIEWGMLVLKLQELRTEEFFRRLVDYVARNRLMFRMVFSENSPGQLRVKFEKIGVKITDVKLSYRTAYRAQGCISVLSKWIYDSEGQPKEFIVKILAELDSNTEKLMRQ